MKITKDQTIKDWAVVEIQNQWGDDARDGIHLSDLLVPRKKYWSVKKPMKAELADILTWLPGIHVESRLLNALGITKGKQKTWNGIIYTPDFFFNFPCEIKSRRRNLAEEGNESDDYDWYIRQLKGYCAVEAVDMGWLIVLSFVQKVDASRKTEPALEFYRVEFEHNEMMEERFRLIEMRSKLIAAITLSSISFKELPRCPAWMCGREIQTMVKKPYCKTCDKEFETGQGIERHLNSKKGKGHDVTAGKYTFSYEPRCKYFDVCVGQEMS